MEEIEEALNFGSVSSAVKIGQTVHRQAGVWTPTIHALLNFLSERGFAFSPIPVGMDMQDREVLNYLPGQAAVRPWPPVLLGHDGLRQAATMLRSYHEIVKDFELPKDAVWRIGEADKQPEQIIRHGDLGPWNTLWQGSTLTGLIDWDFAELGKAVTDLAQMAYYFVPLRSESGWQQAGFNSRPDFDERLHVLCETYGVFTASEVLSELNCWLDEEVRRIRALGIKGIEPWASFMQRGDDVEMTQDLRWLPRYRVH